MKQRVKEMEAEAAKIMEMNEEATKIDTTENTEGKYNNKKKKNIQILKYILFINN